MKRFIVRGFIALIFALILVVVVFGFIQYQFLTANQTQTQDQGVNKLEIEAEETEEIEPNEKGPEEGIPLKSLPISNGQKKVIETIGVDTETFTITPEMAACARKVLGEERYQEVLAGGAPSLAEGVSLLQCAR